MTEGTKHHLIVPKPLTVQQKIAASKEPKKDLIDKVREGYQIRIYDAKPLLKEGDILKDWHDVLGREERKVVGCRIGRRILGRLFGAEQCPYCSTYMHYIRQETRKSREGRDGQVYTITQTRESKYLGFICPLCEYEDEERYSYY